MSINICDVIFEISFLPKSQNASQLSKILILNSLIQSFAPWMWLRYMIISLLHYDQIPPPRDKTSPFSKSPTRFRKTDKASELVYLIYSVKNNNDKNLQFRKFISLKCNNEKAFWT